MTPIQLDAYFDRIRWNGDTAPTLGTLHNLLLAHTANIPFENLDVLIGRGVSLDIEALQKKLVHDRRGGYCFEHATLFAKVLEVLGFKPVRHSARVILFSSRRDSPRTHMFLTVQVEGRRYVLDPGFGAYSSRVPLPLTPSEAASGANDRRVVRDGDVFVLQIRRGEEMEPAWVSNLEEDNPVDFELANYWTATHPGSPFRNIMMLSSVRPDGRVSVMNRNVTRTRGEETLSSELTGRSALRALLAEHFGFDLPEVEQLRVPAIPEW